MDSTCNTHGGIRNFYRVLVWRTEGMRFLRRTRLRWEDNVKMDLTEVSCDEDLIDLPQIRVEWWAYVRAVMNLRFP